MDVILQALDTINEMFEQVQNGEALTPADPALLEELHRLSEPEGEESAAPAAAPEPTPAPAAPAAEETESSADGNDEMTEDEFEALLDELHGSSPQAEQPAAPAPSAPENASSSDEISDDEFESLLDELHGQGAFFICASRKQFASTCVKLRRN